MFVQRCWRAAYWTLVISTVMFALPSAQAQRGRPRGGAVSPEAMMEQFFDQMFGPVDDQAALRDIPVSRQEEQALGDAAADAYLTGLERSGVEVIRRGPDVVYLMRLAHMVRGRMEHSRRYGRLRLYVADSPATDARCFPGGTIVVFRGLLDFAGSEAAMVGVLGHELSHMDRQHQLQSVRRMKYASQAFSQGGFSPEKFFSTGAVLMKGFMRPFRPEHEAEADADGIRWAYELGYDPREFATVFKRLYERDGEQNAVPFLQTHPFRMDRYRDGMQQARELVEADGSRELYIGRRNLKERIPRDVKRFDE